MRVLIIDNFDSFTFNLYQLVGELLEAHGVRGTVDVIRNNGITLREIKKRSYDRIIISPGPGSPDDAAYFGVCKDVLLDVARSTPTLGVCLGMQGIAQYFGGKVVRAKRAMHGKTSEIEHDGKGVFSGLPQGIEVMRYHSLVVTDIPRELIVTARAKDGAKEIMGLRHKTFPLEGIQFHPESYATEGGKIMLQNFLLDDSSLSKGGGGRVPPKPLAKGEFPSRRM